MAFFINLVFLLSWAAVSFTFPHNTFDKIQKGSSIEYESSASGPDEPAQGIVKVVPLDPHLLAQSGVLKRGLIPRRSRLSFPAFLAHGRPALAFEPPLNPLHHLQPKTEMELKKRQSLQMWQRAIHKGDKMSVSLPVNLKDSKQTCTAVSFTQHVKANGCKTVKINNKLCFGQCSSLFVPSAEDFSGPGAGTGLHHRAPCSRCAPSKAHTVEIPLNCGDEVRVKRIILVEECKCETGQEEKNAEAAASPHV